MLSKEILKEEIKKTKDTIKTIKTMKLTSKKKGKEIDEDCEVGIEVNTFVLKCLEDALIRRS